MQVGKVSKGVDLQMQKENQITDHLPPEAREKSIRDGGGVSGSSQRVESPNKTVADDKPLTGLSIQVQIPGIGRLKAEEIRRGRGSLN